MLASGMTVSEIAGYFKRSVSTISKQKTMAMHRLGISTDVDLFAYARESGMVHIAGQWYSRSRMPIVFRAFTDYRAGNLSRTSSGACP